MAKKARNPKLVEPTWGRNTEGGPPVSEFASQVAGGLSPFGEDTTFPLPVSALRYAHPTDKPNRAGLMAGE